MRVENDKRIWKYQHFFECVTKEISGWRQQATFVFVLQISKCFHNYVRWVVRTKQNKVGRVKIRTHGDFVDIVDNRSPVARKLFLQAVDQLSFWKWLHVMMSRSCVFNTRNQSKNHNHRRRNWIFHHMASTIIDHHHHRRNDTKSKKTSSPITIIIIRETESGRGWGRLSQVSWRAVCEIAASECACRCPWVQ